MEKIHATLYGEAKDTVKSGNDLDIGEIYISPVYGHTVVGKAPDRCPLCGVQGNKFKKVSGSTNDVIISYILYVKEYSKKENS